jgi:hypothetical protein
MLFMAPPVDSRLRVHTGRLPALINKAQPWQDRIIRRIALKFAIRKRLVGKGFGVSRRGAKRLGRDQFCGTLGG